MMNLEEAQKKLWIHQSNAPETTQEALARVSQTMIDCIGAFQNDELVAAQTDLEETLAQILIAMKTLNINPSRALERSIERIAHENAQHRVFHIYSNRVEIQVGPDIRGGWPLYSHEDYEAVVALARTFGCEVIHHEAQQLDLFKPAASSTSRTNPTVRNRVPNYYATPLKNTTLPQKHVHPQLTLVSSNDRTS